MPTLGSVFLTGLEAISPSTPKVVSTINSSSTLLPGKAFSTFSFIVGEYGGLSSRTVGLSEEKQYKQDVLLNEKKTSDGEANDT